MEKFDLSPLFFEETKLPEILYHYTSVPSFVSLMDKDAYFYATHFAFLNDGLEIGYGQSIFDEYVRINYPDLDKEYGNSFRIREKGHYAWFVASFSEVSDDLSQWRAYTDKSEGGFAIGFNMEEIKKHISYDILKDSKIELSERIAAFLLNINQSIC